MLVLTRNWNQWVKVTDIGSGREMGIVVLGFEKGPDGEVVGVRLGFDDAPRHFDIQRPERPRTGHAPRQ